MSIPFLEERLYKRSTQNYKTIMKLDKLVKQHNAQTVI